MSAELNEVNILQLWKDEMIRRLIKEALDAIEPSVRKHATEIVESMNMAAKKDMDYREHQLIIRLFGKVSEWEYKEIK